MPIIVRKMLKSRKYGLIVEWLNGCMVRWLNA